ncbi:TOBE domain-containing protein [Ruficoccus amylovorans]|uniref:TOBE domain-containing protein n=1 Tax=Ruficoccus amylovorans TaxID=1804625 RepID=A0A842H956_9BACT|nr:molybdopterin-binding protein [Ruficoccus amylovorans]MBC2592942.1 TOBE domain-containing protein [Ruficoccus amylovorans]
MKISARNQLKGKVVSIEKGSVNSEVVIALAGGEEVVSIITNHAVESLGLSVGGCAVAVIKASSVLLGIED